MNLENYCDGCTYLTSKGYCSKITGNYMRNNDGHYIRTVSCVVDGWKTTQPEFPA